MSFIKGNFHKYIFRSDKGYVIGLVKVNESDISSLIGTTTTITGYFHELNENDLYVFNGSLVEHERYGEQFNVDSYDIILPSDKDKIIEFLSSNLFPGIGDKKASKIVDVLGCDALKMILDDPNCLLKVPTVTLKQKDTIYSNLVKYQYSFEVIVSLTKKGFNTKDALTIYNYYTDDTTAVILDNPYKIIDDITDIGFKKVDAIRSSFNILDNDIRRVEAAIKYVIDMVNFNIGNTYLERVEIINYVRRVLFINDLDLINNAIDNLVHKNEIMVNGDNYSLKKMYKAESYIARILYNLANVSSNTIVKDSDITLLEEYYSIKYNDMQKKAIKNAIEKRILIITGGPGTGKTTIIKAICKLYQDLNGYSSNDLNKYLALVAPTGRAAKRIASQTNLEASTIHRFLKWNKEDDTFRVNEDNKSDVRFIIIDEASMIDTYLFYNLLLGLNYNTKIVIIGDYNQLPSVGAGQVLKDLIESDAIDVVKLEKLYRQEDNSNINLFAHDIINNNLDMSLFTGDDLEFVPANNIDLKSKMDKYLDLYKDYDINKFQVLAPIYKGDNGIDDLNFYMQKKLNSNLKNKNSTVVDGVLMYEGDKVIDLVNMPDDNVFNGDIGAITKINNNPKELYIDFMPLFVKFTPANFSNLHLGYAISIHKSQGSEFDVVIIPILNKYSNMLYKKLIYTAVTRAKKKLIIIGEEQALSKAILNDRENKRKTNLKNFIISCINT